MDFRVVSEITEIEVIARGGAIREHARLRKRYGGVTWRKLKGVARVELLDGEIRQAEVHWYECHGIGKRELKLKPPFLDLR